jgi:glucan-binding YG repeat protein
MKKRIVHRLIEFVCLCLFFIVILSPESFAEEIGWHKDDNGKWYYYYSETEHCSCGFYQIGGKRYLFEGDGTLAQGHAGWYEVEVVGPEGGRDVYKCNLDSEGAVVEGWEITQITFSDGYLFETRNYIDENGNLVSGWRTIEGKKYYFSPSQVCPTGGVWWIDGKVYLFDTDGSLVLGHPGLYKVVYPAGGSWRGKYTVFGESFSPEQHSGAGICTTVNDTHIICASYGYTVDAEGVVVEGISETIIEYDSDYRFEYRCYLGEDLNAFVGWKQLDGKTYYFGPGQAAMNGGISRIGDKAYAFDSTGALVLGHAGWYEISGPGDVPDITTIIRGYTIDDEGAVQAGWSVERQIYENGETHEYWYYVDALGELQTGWQKIDGKWYYFSWAQECRNGGMLWVEDKYYLFGNDGALIQNQPGWHELVVSLPERNYTIGCTINSEGAVQPGWRMEIRDNTNPVENWFYMDSNGECAKGWKQIGAEKYYFETWSGIQLNRAGGFHAIDGKTYLFGEGGAVIQNSPGWHEMTMEEGENSHYIGCNINTEGAITTGWYIERYIYEYGYTYESRRYSNAEGVFVSGWQTIDGKTFYFSPTNKDQVCYGGGVYTIDGKTYIFDKDGALEDNTPGWHGKRYINEDGSLAIGWKKIDDKWYYFNSWDYEICCPNGGTSLIDGKTYLFGEDGALVQNQAGWYEVSRESDYYGTGEMYNIVSGYTIDAEGAVQEGWSVTRYTNISTGYSREEWYYLNSSGESELGWKKLNGKWYYFSPQQVCRNGGSDLIDDKAYIFDDEGALIQSQPGWYETTVHYGDELTLPGAYYFINSEVVARGWLKIDGKWYYFYPEQACHNGAGIAYIDDKRYVFGDDGALVQNQAGWYELTTYQYDDGTTLIEGYTIDAEGAVKGGWHMRKYVYQEGGSWEYWEYLKDDGSCELGWKKLDGKWYYFEPSQVCRTGGTYTIDGKLYLFGEDGALVQRQPGWYVVTKQYEGGWVTTIRYYFKNSEELATGWYKIDGKWYYFNEWSGTPQFEDGGIYEIDGKLYLFDNDCALVYGQPGQQSVRITYDSEYNEYSCVVNSEGIVQDGWVVVHHYWLGYGRIIDDRYYVSGGVYAHGWQKIDGKWYYFTLEEWSDGRMICREAGTQTIDGKLYYFNEDGSLLQHGAGWFEIVENNWDGPHSVWYYFVNAEELATGWTKIGGDWYYFDTNGKQLGRAETLLKIGEKYYAFDENGKLLQYKAGLYKTPKMKDPSGVEHESAWYYLATDGEILVGWKRIDGKWYYFNDSASSARYGQMVCPEGGTYTAEDGKPYYFDTDGSLLTGKPGWKNWDKVGFDWVDNLWLDSLWSYIDNNGVAATGLQTINGKKYYFNDRGIMFENDIAYVGDNYYVFGAGGAQVTKAGWCKILSNPNTQEYSWYYINEDGTAKTGWLKDGGKWYYLFPRMACNETATVIEGDVGKQYFFDKSGALVQYNAGWNKRIRTVKGETLTDWYYLNSAGETLYGYRQIDGKWYCFRDYDGTMVSGQLYEVDGEYKLFTNDGSQAVTQGWYKCRNYYEWDGKWYTQWYYIDSDGKLADGWKKIDGKWYYFYEGRLDCADGGVSCIEEKYYFFANGGALGAKGWNKLTKTVDGQTQTYWYYLNAAGEVQTGWQKVNGKWYYLAEDYYDERGRMYSDGIYLVNGTYEYFDQNGICVTAMGSAKWRRVGDGLRYVLADGTFATGWNKIGTKDYFFDENGEMMRGWIEYNGNKYYFDPNPLRGWCSAWDEEGNQHDYLFESDGALVCEKTIMIPMYRYGGYSYDGEELCFYGDDQGRLYSGWKQLNGKWYYFNPWMMKDCVVYDNERYYRLDKDGVWTGESWKATD